MKSQFHFDNSYRKLSEKFYEEVNPFLAPHPELVLLNEELMQEVDLEMDEEELLPILAGNNIAKGSEPIAEAHAGHHFGLFRMLGDRRGVLLGEHLTHSGKRLDIELNGSGQTPF